MGKVDFRKEYKELYSPPSREVVLVDVPRLRFLMIDGSGDPNGSREFQEAVEALYGLSFTAKFMLKKKGTGEDYAVSPLEGLWWMEDGSVFSMEKREGWRWTLMIMQPEWVDSGLVTEAASQLERKKNLPALDKVRLEDFLEGLSVQIMHIGPYAEEQPTIDKLRRFAEEKGYRLRGKHHEIYLSDPRRADPRKLRTVLRHPVEKV